MGQQPHVSIRDRQLFHGGLAVDHGCHEFTVAGVVLGADDNVVSVEYTRVDHGLAGDLKHEEVAVTRHGGGQAENLFDVLLGGDGSARGNAADERDGAALLLHVGHRNFDGHDRGRGRTRQGDAERASRLVCQVEGARQPGFAREVARGFENIKVVFDS